MTVAHKNLTGTDLHEIKGASTATAGQVPVADGLGGAVFGKLTASSLQTTGNPFGAQLLHVREEQSSGVGSTSGYAAAFNAIVLNTVKTNEISGASLGSNLITLPAGTYYIEASAPWTSNLASSGGGGGKLQLANVTAGTITTYGTSGYFVAGTGGAYANGTNVLKGRFTVAGATVFQLRQYISSGSSTPPFSAGTEVYGEALIWKII